MLVTQEEARGKWCPLSRVARHEIIHNTNDHGAYNQATIIGGVNRDALGKAESPIASCRCIASDCMAWRWYEFETTDEDKRAVGTRGMCGAFGRQY